MSRNWFFWGKHHPVPAVSNWETDSEKANSDNDSNTSSGWGMEDNYPVSDMVIQACSKLYENFYIKEHCKIPKTCENLDMLLTQYKTGFPDIFHSYLCITPECFDSLLESIQHHEALHNNSNNPQMPVE